MFTRLLRISAFLLTGTLLFACGGQSAQEPLTHQSLEAGFVNPPDSIRVGTYWYWMPNHLSREGVIKDLEAMKAAGIGRAYIGNIWEGYTSDSMVHFGSDEWWEILRAALKRAGELDIEIGIFNAPGWSQSGGPWVRPKESMRYLAMSEIHVTGPQRITERLPLPGKNFQDMRVIAYPMPVDYDVTMAAQITSQPESPDTKYLTDGDSSTRFTLAAGQTYTFDLTAVQPFTARSLVLCPDTIPLEAKCQLQVREGGSYRTISEFNIDRRRAQSIQVGFDRAAPLVKTFPECTAQTFRLILQNKGQTSALTKIELSASPRIDSYDTKTLAKMYPAPLATWDTYRWDPSPVPGDTSLVISPYCVEDISQYMTPDGTLTWNVPDGKWVILRLGMLPTGITNSPAAPEATGLEIDKMDRSLAEAHFDRFIGQILQRIPAKERRTFKTVVIDSYEAGSTNFTDNFIAMFRKQYGYDPVPYLPAYFGYVVGAAKVSDRFLWDVRRLVADCLAQNYIGALRDRCHRYGLELWMENYGHWGFPGEFLQYGGLADRVSGEFWAEGDLGSMEVRAASSCGHIYGKNRISAESFTSSGREFERYPAQLKQRADRFAAEGVNDNILHVYISQPNETKPGNNAWFGTEFNRGNTWFSQLDLFTTYLRRCNFMLQQGHNVADVAYYIGEGTPKMTGPTDPPLPEGYQFDFINAEVIERDMRVENGLLTLSNGTQYRILVLPQLETMRPELLRKIRDLVAAGGVVLGPPPTHSPSLQGQPTADATVTELAAELWQDVDGVTVRSAQFGAGMILNGMTLAEAFELIDCPPDCQLPDKTPIRYAHRHSGAFDIYFLTNQGDSPIQCSPTFRVSGKQPELWSPASGEIRLLPAFTSTNETTTVPLKLDRNESVFIVFADPAKPTKADKTSASKKGVSAMAQNYPEPQLLSVVSGPWNVTFDPAMRGPEQPITLARLEAWNRMANDSIRFYSGTASYRTGFSVMQRPEGKRILLDLGSLSVMAKVYINDHYVGGVWTPPYRLDITDWVQQGRNELCIEVVNTWTNRLIGDSRLPAAQRGTWCRVNSHRPFEPLQTSGLLGPVQLFTVQYKLLPIPGDQP